MLATLENALCQHDFDCRLQIEMALTNFVKNTKAAASCKLLLLAALAMIQPSLSLELCRTCSKWIVFVEGTMQHKHKDSI